eukprot:3748551-Alexandrium_andersonii.AAC.1
MRSAGSRPAAEPPADATSIPRPGPPSRASGRRPRAERRRLATASSTRAVRASSSEWTGQTRSSTMGTWRQGRSN